MGPGTATTTVAGSPRCPDEEGVARGRAANPPTVARGALHPAGFSLTQAPDRVAEYGAEDPAAASAIGQTEPSASAAHCGLPDGIGDRKGLALGTALDLRSHPQRDDPGGPGR